MIHSGKCVYHCNDYVYTLPLSFICLYFCRLTIVIAYMKVYGDNYESLVNVLPMNDALFTAKLTSKSLLPEDVGNRIDSLAAKADKAKYFLQNVIKPSLVVNDKRDFNTFILIMKESDYRPLNMIAAKMKEELEGILSTYVP